jgi:hypothetical protein
MGDSVLEHIERDFAWIEDFDVLIWSFQHRMAKPEPGIYRLLLERLARRRRKRCFWTTSWKTSRPPGIWGFTVCSFLPSISCDRI